MDFFYIYEDCRTISGYKNNILYDLTRNDIYTIPSKLKEVIRYNRTPYLDIPKSIRKYADFLINHEFAIKLPLELLSSFPKLLLESHIENINSVIIFCKLSLQKHELLIKALTRVGGEYVILKADLYQRKQLLLLIENLIFHGFTRIDLIFEDVKKYDNIYTTITGVGTIVIYKSTDKVEVTETGVLIINRNKRFEDVILNSESKIQLENFLINRKNFIMNHRVNSYFSQKVFIDSEFNIKNAVECDQIYGNINTISDNEFEAVVLSKYFRKYDEAIKDKFIDCSVCEFRYCCNDNRLPIRRNNGSWYHKTECNYNPYIAKWKGEEGYRTLAECGVISNEEGFSIDHERIAKINEELWGE